MSESLHDILLSSRDAGFEAGFAKLRSDMLQFARLAGADSAESQTVARVLGEVAEQGDGAVAKYTKEFDRVDLSPSEFRVQAADLAMAHAAVDGRLLGSLRKAIENVRAYQRKIFIGGRSELSQGTGIRYTPIRRVGVCVPGAAAPLPSTVIMTVVPAQVAGVKEIAVVSPPRWKGTIHPVILAVCHELGIDEVYRIGGVQAVGALAYGTQTIRKVDKIVGPGNKWVQAAKKQVAGDHVAIDSIAGPSEVLILADDQANPAWVAVDMLSQAEHGTDSSAIVLTDSQSLAQAIVEQLAKQLETLPRAAEARESLKRFSRIIVVADMDEAVRLADEFASEHLEVQCGTRSREIAARITNAGAIFIGPHTPVAVGDYWAGPSHTLPTGSRAKFSSAVTSNDFVKSISLIEYTAEQLAASADDIIRMAEVEGLDAHARSVAIRRQG
ncbi:MAG TPA: histidinol dehydrogenase [Sedimentisphaerales bacterium]|jgi:histidinol dehydrogenase|nr:histidinol dehydrogenase [Sedimentisphaerales bacterium]HNU31371.1 histidinol dehydrogenase [Sedimentisphaerales bacterium]